MRERTLLLLDVDGVLLYPRGYKEALRAALNVFADQMGFPPVDLTYEEIAVFEAAGMTNEWLSGAMCLAALVMAAIGTHGELARENLAATFAAIAESGCRVDRPDFIALTRDVLAIAPEGIHTAAPIRAVLGQRAAPPLQPLLDEILGDIRPPAPFAYIFQHFTLGDQRFTETYGIPARFRSESYLATLDHPTLSESGRACLEQGAAEGAYGLAIYTARPSLPPADLDPTMLAAVDRAEHPPEGDLAADLLDFARRPPLIAGGRMTWLAMRHAQHPGAYIKPSPVHALATIAAAHCGAEQIALEAAAALAQDGLLTGPLADLRGMAVRAVVFEDSLGGIQGMREAAHMLHEAGLDITVEAVGVAPEPSKQAALRRAARRVEADLNAALQPYLPCL
ncbi:MAG: hypothetical protein Kow00124_30250 [Anaerolineae bacterium]